jgi:hypothetical protein
MILLLAFAAFGQEEQKLVGEIEFYGYAGIDLKKLKDSLPFEEGDEFNIEKEGQLAKMMKKAEESVRKILARPAADIAPVCCDKQGNWMIYIGLFGKTPSYHPQPGGKANLPGKIIDLYERFEEQLEDAIKRGVAQEDQSQGYALSVDPPLRKTQMEMREYALDQGDLVRDVLMNAKEDKHRIAAAEILGYATQSKAQIVALVHAARDVNRIVRNNATRALWILVNSNPELAAEVPMEFYIDMLLSPKWTDANKASLTLSSMTEQNNPEILNRLRQKDVRERLIEMARWRTWHADYAKYLLGRLAGIDEERLKELVNSGQTDAIINRLSP